MDNVPNCRSESPGLRDLVECLVCWDHPEGRIYGCVNGHIICESCRKRLALLCPLCKVEMNTRCLKLEQLRDRLGLKSNTSMRSCEESESNGSAPVVEGGSAGVVQQAEPTPPTPPAPRPVQAEEPAFDTWSSGSDGDGDSIVWDSDFAENDWPVDGEDEDMEGEEEGEGVDEEGPEFDDFIEQLEMEEEIDDVPDDLFSEAAEEQSMAEGDEVNPDDLFTESDQWLFDESTNETMFDTGEDDDGNSQGYESSE